MDSSIVDRGRGPQIAGTRITVFHIMDYLKLGWHYPAIAAWLRISSSQVLAAVKYIQEHREELQPEYEAILEREARGNPPEVKAKLATSHAKLQALVAKIRRDGSLEAKHAGNPGRQQ